MPGEIGHDNDMERKDSWYYKTYLTTNQNLQMVGCWYPLGVKMGVNLNIKI